jgi:hypothetical protein
MRGLMIAILVATVSGAGAEKIISGYTGAFYGDKTEAWRSYIPLMKEAGFNCLDLKVHPANFDPADPGYREFVGQVARAVDEAGLQCHLWLYDAGRGQRGPQTPGPAFVGPDGRVDEARHCLYQLESWESAMGRMFVLAELSRTLPIRSVKMDIEMMLNLVPCVCDQCFGSYVAARGQQLPAPVAPAQRWAWVKQHGGEEAYGLHLEERMGRVVQAFAQQAHAINPRLSLGLMPYADDPLRRPWARYLATPEAPAYIESWPMYNGLGYTAEVDEIARDVKALNPHNLYIPWFRINMYGPADLAQQAYIATARGDGYNMWTIGMIHPQVAGGKVNPGYELPVGFPDPLAYWRELGQANRRLQEPLPAEVPLRPLQPLVVNVDLAKVPVPPLKAVLPAAPELEKTPTPTGLRGNSRLYVQVDDPAVAVRFTVRHLAGQARPTNLGLALVAANGAPLIEAQVAPGETKELTVPVKQPGTYALLIETAVGGGPWYDVRVLSHPYAVDAAAAYYFRHLPRQYFWVPAGTKQFRVQIQTGASEAARLRVWRPDGSPAADVIHLGDTKRAQVETIAVPAELAGQVWSLWVGKPETMQATHYSENYHLKLLDIPPYLSDRPAAVLQPAY